MKLSKISTAFLVLVLGLVSVSCSVQDEPVVVIPKTAEQYKADFTDYVTSQLSFVNTCQVGYNKGDFAQISASSFNTYKNNYLTALKADSTVLSAEAPAIADMVNANTALATPGKAFWGKINISDRRPLNDSIVAANNFLNSVSIGTSPGQYLQADANTFNTAINSAISTRDATTTIDRQVTDGITALTTAKQAFQAAIIK